MDAALLSKLIKDIVLEKDSVSLPGLGTFVTELVPSTFSDRGYTINPPYRRLSFTQKNTEDGLLEARLADENIGAGELTGFLARLKEDLKQRKAIALPGLGRLRATRENHFFFVPDENLDIWPAGFGLDSISLKNHQETPEEIATAVSTLADAVEAPVPTPVISTKVRRTAWRNLIIILVSVALLAFIGLAILGRVAPDFIDRLLYSPEELQTLKTLNL